MVPIGFDGGFDGGFHGMRLMRGYRQSLLPLVDPSRNAVLFAIQ